jgi:spermidine synthase
VTRVRVVRDGVERVFIKLYHGTTLHGQQRADESGPPRPMTYYHERGPVGHLFAALPPEKLRKVAVVGLGTGAVAAYARPGQDWIFYEIDPAVVQVANNEEYFRFLSSCQGKSCNVVLGDARRQLTRAANASFDLIILDGFCSDAIPVHLLTREAIRLYVQKLAPDGVILLHVSNVHLDLPPLIRRLADDHEPRLAVRYCPDMFPTESERADGKTMSQWMVMARSEADLSPLLDNKRVKGTTAKFLFWETVPWQEGPIWRDDFANLLRVWKKREE